MRKQKFNFEKQPDRFLAQTKIIPLGKNKLPITHEIKKFKEKTI